MKAFGVSGRGDSWWLEPSQYAAARDPHFRLYVVENVRQGDPKLFSLLAWPTAIYDKMQVERLL